MKINISKTVFIRFGNCTVPVDYQIQKECIKQVDYVKDLSLLVDRKLSFGEHCLKVVKNQTFCLIIF